MTENIVVLIKTGSLDEIKKLREEKIKDGIEIINNSIFILACMYQNIVTISYLLGLPEIKTEYEKIANSLVSLVSNGKVEVFDFLINQEMLKKYLKKDFFCNCFHHAIYFNKKDFVNYLDLFLDEDEKIKEINDVVSKKLNNGMDCYDFFEDNFFNKIDVKNTEILKGLLLKKDLFNFKKTIKKYNIKEIKKEINEAFIYALKIKYQEAIEYLIFECFVKVPKNMKLEKDVLRLFMERNLPNNKNLEEKQKNKI